MTQILSWNSRLVPHDLYELDSDLEYLQWREKFFQRIFLHTPGPIDVGYSLHKIEVQRNPLLLFQCLIFNIREIMSLQLLNSRKEPFFSETAVAMADIIANTLMVVLLYVLWIGCVACHGIQIGLSQVNRFPLALPPGFTSFLASWPWQVVSSDIGDSLYCTYLPQRTSSSQRVKTRSSSQENETHSGSESD